jgi:hypothetical protein
VWVPNFANLQILGTSFGHHCQIGIANQIWETFSHFDFHHFHCHFQSAVQTFGRLHEFCKFCWFIAGCLATSSMGQSHQNKILQEICSGSCASSPSLSEVGGTSPTIPTNDASCPDHLSAMHDVWGPCLGSPALVQRSSSKPSQEINSELSGIFQNDNANVICPSSGAQPFIFSSFADFELQAELDPSLWVNHALRMVQDDQGMTHPWCPEFQGDLGPGHTYQWAPAHTHCFLSAAPHGMVHHVPFPSQTPLIWESGSSMLLPNLGLTFSECHFNSKMNFSSSNWIFPEILPSPGLGVDAFLQFWGFQWKNPLSKHYVFPAYQKYSISEMDVFLLTGQARNYHQVSKMAGIFCERQELGSHFSQIRATMTPELILPLLPTRPTLIPDQHPVYRPRMCNCTCGYPIPRYRGGQFPDLLRPRYSDAGLCSGNSWFRELSLDEGQNRMSQFGYCMYAPCVVVSNNVTYLGGHGEGGNLGHNVSHERETWSPSSSQEKEDEGGMVLPRWDSLRNPAVNIQLESAHVNHSCGSSTPTTLPTCQAIQGAMLVGGVIEPS